MIITVRTSNAQRKLKIDSLEQLEAKIKESFKTEEFCLFSDLERTKQISLSDVKENTTIYMSYDMPEAKIFKKEYKCNHSPDAVCPNCAGIQPESKTIAPDKKVKYLSYKSYLQALESKSMKEEEYNYEIIKCDQHPANQKCSKCMDRQITLVPQIFRHIDYVEFDSKSIVERIINNFKESRRQQMGILLGKYSEYSEVPMGKKAIVSAVWMVEQEKFPDGFAINDIPLKFFCKELEILGVVYTDLLFKDKKLTSSKVINNYPISTSEIDFIGSLRDHFDKKEFFGVCVSANQDGDISPEVFMVTEQFQSLNSANALSLTTDPTKFSTKRDIVYFINNEYNKKVSQKADPYVPIFYFIVKCEIGYKENPIFTHETTIKRPTFKKLSAYFESQFNFEKFRNFNILICLNAFIPTLVPELFSAVINKDEEKIAAIVATPEFLKFKQELDKYDVKSWACSACTFLNDPLNSSCEICGTPKI